MRRLLLLATMVFVAMSAWSHTNYVAPGLDHMPICVSNDTSMVMMRYYPDSGVYDLLLIYESRHDGAGNINLKGVAEAKFRGHGDSYFTKNVPEDIVIVDAYTDHPRMTGKFNTPLEPTESEIGINYEVWQIGQSVIDYHNNPDDYGSECVDKMSSDAFALVETYKAIAGKRSNEQWARKKQIEKEKAKTSGTIMLVLLLPLIASIVLGMLTSNNRISNNFSQKIRAVAITEAVGLVAALCCFRVIVDATWWMITLAVLGIIVLLVYDLFFAVFTGYHIIQTQQAKLPWPQLIIFGLESLLVPMCVMGAIYGIIAPIRGISLSGNDVAGIVSSVVFLGVYYLTALWFRSALVKRAPSMERDFWPLAVVTFFAFWAVLSFIFIIIGVCIWKGVFKMGINEMVNGGPTGVVSSGDGPQSCLTCSRCGSDCPYSREHGSPTQICSYYVARH